jgi:hypothetical protein
LLAICAALQWEIRAVLSPLRQVQRTDLDGVRLWLAAGRDESLLVFRTGVGLDRAAAATRTVMSRFPLSAIINTGFAGGLIDTLEPGALIVPDVIIREEPNGKSVHHTDRGWSNQLRHTIHAVGLNAISEPVLTSPFPLTTTAAKRDAHIRLGAVAVEMEGQAVARMAAEGGVPFATVRSVLDPAEMPLPLLSWARPRPPREFDATSGPLLQPAEFQELFSFANSVRIAQRSLSTVFLALLFGQRTWEVV